MKGLKNISLKPSLKYFRPPFWKKQYHVKKISVFCRKKVLLFGPDSPAEPNVRSITTPNQSMWFHTNAWQNLAMLHTLFFRIRQKQDFIFFEMVVHWKLEKIHLESAKEGSRKHFSIYVLKRCAYVASSCTMAFT